MRARILFLIVLSTAVVARAQEDNTQTAVTNEDGGKAFIVRTVQLTDSVKLISPIDGEIEQHSIFLGAGWAGSELRPREPDLGNLLLHIHEHLRPDELERSRIRNRFAPTFSQEKLDISGGRTISDLEIQKVIAGMLKDGTLGPARAGTIYMIFLDADLHSTLGTLVAEKHYQAYHAFFNASGSRVHYVVLPFQSDPQAARQIALNAFLVAATHPLGS